jgi:hypothetical protein
MNKVLRGLVPPHSLDVSDIQGTGGNGAYCCLGSPNLGSPEGSLVKDLDHRLAALGWTEIDHDLSALESAVWSRVEAREGLQPLSNRVAVAMCATVAMLASGAGAAAAAAARTAPEAEIFAIHAPLAPSTVLSD